MRNLMISLALGGFGFASAQSPEAPQLAKPSTAPPQTSYLTGQPLGRLQFAVPPVTTVQLLRPVAAPDTCYAMRSYSFSAADLDTAAPHPSKYTTCTRSSWFHLKSAEQSVRLR